MARPPQEAIDTFKDITGASDDVALFKLEEHRGDLNAAINAHFSEADRLNMQDHPNLNVLPDFMDIDAQLDMNRFAVLDPRSHPLGLDARNARNNDAPRVSHPREVREIPIEVKDGSSHSGQLGPSIQNVTSNVIEYGPANRGSVIIDDDEGNPLAHTAVQNARDSNDLGFSPVPSAPIADDATYVDNEIEEQMILAAIEASKQDADKSEDEAAAYNKPLQFGPNESSSSAAVYLPGMEKIWNANGRQEPGILNDETSSRSRSEDDDASDSEEQPLTRRRSSRRRSTTGNGQSVNRLSSRSGIHEDHPQHNGNDFSDEWAGISSEERDEAVMLEATLFGGVPNSTYPFAFPSQSLSERHIPFNDQLPRSPSPTLLAQRTLREQQDDEYMAALAADKEKELKAMQDAEYRRSEEEAAKAAALELERSRKEEAERQLLEKQEYERQLAVKQASLPQEPASDDENAVTLLIRMPDGSRLGRRFLKSEKLQCLFDFIDVGKVVKPSTYRLVRPYPRQVFGEGEKELSLCELGLTNKQEALFLEMI